MRGERDLGLQVVSPCLVSAPLLYTESAVFGWLVDSMAEEFNGCG